MGSSLTLRLNWIISCITIILQIPIYLHYLYHYLYITVFSQFRNYFTTSFGAEQYVDIFWRDFMNSSIILKYTFSYIFFFFSQA